MAKTVKIKKIYIAGKMTGKEDYRRDFEHAEMILKAIDPNLVILNPIILPEGLEYEEYMLICFAMINAVDTVCMLPDWKDSKGAIRERDRAIITRKNVVEYENLVKDLER